LRPPGDRQGITLSIVVPAHNEADNVAPLAERIATAVAHVGPWELIFVDDGSRDGTLAAVKALADRDRRIRYVSFTRNFGHQAALRAGLRHARGTAVVVMDADLEHPPELISALVQSWRDGAGIVLTQRRTKRGQTSAFKRLTSRGYYWLLNNVGDVAIESGSADFMLLDRAAVEAINRFENQDVFLRGLVRWLGFPLAKVSYDQGDRQTGESKFTLRRMIDFAVTGIIAHSIKPLRIAIHLSLGFTLLALALIAYTLGSFLWSDRTITGWTSIMAAIAVLGAGQFLVLGIIGEYVGRVLREARGWPLYLIAETDETSDKPRIEQRTPDETLAGRASAG
jgi:polyisoprenyl-phosphate glycosyltransferase